MTESTHNQLLLALQRGIPIIPRPFAAIGEAVGLTERDVLAQILELFSSGTGRRLGAVFNPRSLGYDSTLCAVTIPDDDLQQMVEALIPHPGITHCYERSAQPNLWFTLTAPMKTFPAEIDQLAKKLSPHKLLNLPALRRFKIQVIFDTTDGQTCGAQSPAPQAASGTDTSKLKEEEKRVVRAIQGDIPLEPTPFAKVAAQTGLDESKLISLLTQWQKSGRIRRIALILRHHKLGFSANGMCTWRLETDQIEEAGTRLAACKEVTHCYERPLTPAFPFNLFAMVHGDSVGAAEAILERISAAANLPEGQILISTREFKKTSPLFFEET